MYKKLALVFLCGLFFSQEQQAMLRPSLVFLKNFKNAATPFTKNFLQLADEIKFIENVQIISLFPLQKEVEEKIYEMQKNGTLIKMILGASVYKNQKEMIAKINKKRAIIACLPKNFSDLDWGISADFLGKNFEIRLLQDLDSQSKIQTALFFGEAVDLSAVLSRETEIENSKNIGSKNSLLVVKHNSILGLLEDDFEAILQKYKK